MEIQVDMIYKNSDLLFRALSFATAAHESVGQLRKYSDDPYIVHPIAVYSILYNAGVNDVNVLSAALLHDVLEDVAPLNKKYDADEILRQFGPEVHGYVDELTDKFTKENYPELNRAQRKQREAERISQISDGALRVKLADLIHNTVSIAENDPNFAVVYLREKRFILEMLTPRIRDSKDDILISLYNQAKSQLIYHESKR